jgi:outer membrane protein assembly factor BamB
VIPALKPSELARAAQRAFAIGFVAFARAATAAEPTPAATLIAAADPGWPQFRGPRRDGVSDEKGLLQEWKHEGPRLIWSAAGVGRGFSSAIVADGRVYTTGDFGEELRIVAHDLNGTQVWTARNGDAWLNQYPGARASVTYHRGHVYHQNAHGRVACFDAATGREVWAVNVLQQFRGENITWGMSECVIVDERAVYVTAGGDDALIVALNRLTGDVLWKSEALPAGAGERGNDRAGYAAPILVQFAGRRLIVGCSSRHLFCADAVSGAIQWAVPRPTSYSVLAMSPVLVGDGVFFAAPFGPPGTLYRLIAPTSVNSKVGMRAAWTHALDAAQGGVVLAGDKLFGAYYPRRGGWAAIRVTTGESAYEAPEIVKGSAVFADGRLYLLSEDGWMLLVEAAADAFEVKGKFRLANARDRDAWAHPVIHGGRLYLRYHDTVYCYDVKAR